MMKRLQKLGKALMLPVAVLPICGILMGLGYAIAPGAMGVPDAVTEGFAYTLGLFLIKAGGAVIDNMAILFAIGVGVGLSKDNDGTGGCPGLLADDDHSGGQRRRHHPHSH
jgi:PTS system N-acetylglucosamine-specific IIC component